MAADQRPLAIALMGPTASGKTALALEWAQRLGGEIVSVDSALVYRGLDIGAAKPIADERAQVPHHLIDLRDPWQPYSAADFAAMRARAIDDIVARGKLPILAGGTGLYFHALLHGLSPMPEADPATARRHRARGRRARAGPRCTPNWRRSIRAAATRIHATDPQRIQRALEVYRVSGRPISDGRRKPRATACRCACSSWCWRRATARCCMRASRSVSTRCSPPASSTRSARCARCRNCSAIARPLDLPAMRAVGYRQAWEHLDGATPPPSSATAPSPPPASSPSASYLAARRTGCALVRSARRPRSRWRRPWRCSGR